MRRNPISHDHFFFTDESTPRFDEEKFKSDYADTIKEERDAARDERVSIMAGKNRKIKNVCL